MSSGTVYFLKATFKRDPSFIRLTFLMPMMVLTALVILTFLLPPDSESKLDIQMSAMLAHSVYMTVISDSLPPTQSGSKICRFSPH